MNGTPKSYFERMYTDSADPWGFETRPYEKRKYALTLAALPLPLYRRVFEPGCSIGVLTELLASRCRALLGYELIAQAAGDARKRTQSLSHVVIEKKAIPDDWPSGHFDLIVLSEVAYYLNEEDVLRLLAKVRESLDDGGHLAAVHYRGETDYPLSGDRVHALIRDRSALAQFAHYEERSFVLDIMEKRSQ